MYDQCPIQELETLSLSSFVSNYTDPFSFFHVLPTVLPTHWSRNFTLLSPILLWDAFADPFSGGVGIAIKVCVSLFCIVIIIYFGFGFVFDYYLTLLDQWKAAICLKMLCVCKSWSALISSQFFITQHIQSTSNNDNRLIVLNDMGDARLVVFDDETHDAVVVSLEIPKPYVVGHMELEPRFVGACNGILCIVCDIFVGHHTHIIKLWNPATKEMKVLPIPNLTPPCKYLCSTRTRFGFGFDAKTSDYKVVRIVNFNPPAVEVYSLSTNSWKIIRSQVPFFRFDKCLPCACTYLDGVYYWWAYEMGDVLLSFDMTDEEFQMTPLPIGRIDHPELICLSVLRGSIALIVHRGDDDDLSRLEVWLIDKHVKNSSWIKHSTVEMGSRLFVSQQLGFGMIDDILLVCDLGLLSYDIKSQVVRNLHIYYGPPDVSGGVRVVAYKESLVSLKTRNEELQLQ